MSCLCQEGSWSNLSDGWKSNLTLSLAGQIGVGEAKMMTKSSGDWKTQEEWKETSSSGSWESSVGCGMSHEDTSQRGRAGL